MTVRDPAKALLEKLRDYPNTVQERALQARAMLLGHAPDCWELLYHRRVLSTAFSHTGALRDAFCHIAVYQAHANLGFNRGAELDDPQRRLLGTGKLIRHVRLSEVLTLDDDYLATLVEGAIALSLQRLRENGGVPTRGTLLVK
ncbi:MAG: DUF1801 domain-containing protein [Pseudomonadota bacterium]